MKQIQVIFFIAALFIPVTVSGHENHWGNPWNDRHHYRGSDSYHPSGNTYGYDRNYYRDDHKKRTHSRGEYQKRKKVPPGWDISPKIAKRASNCYRYTLSAKGGRGSARITSIPGKNYIQVQGKRSGYVCFQGEPTLELGKLGNPDIKVTLRLEGRGKFKFHPGQTGSSYRNHWYRSYWNL